MKIDKTEYENLVRDSEKERIIESFITSGETYFTLEQAISIVSGYERKEKSPEKLSFAKMLGE